MGKFGLEEHVCGTLHDCENDVVVTVRNQIHFKIPKAFSACLLGTRVNACSLGNRKTLVFGAAPIFELVARMERQFSGCVGIDWRNYCGATLVNSYPTYLEKLPPLIERIKSEQRNSKNYVLFLGSTDAESNQAPCLSLVRFQIELGELVLTAYQRSSDTNLCLPADLYHLYLMARFTELPFRSITLNIGNVHIYEDNITKTQESSSTARRALNFH